MNSSNIHQSTVSSLNQSEISFKKIACISAVVLVTASIVAAIALVCFTHVLPLSLTSFFNNPILIKSLLVAIPSSIFILGVAGVGVFVKYINKESDENLLPLNNNSLIENIESNAKNDDQIILSKQITGIYPSAPDKEIDPTSDDQIISSEPIKDIALSEPDEESDQSEYYDCMSDNQDNKVYPGCKIL